MKYALIKNETILTTSNEEFESIPEGMEVVELTDEQAEQLEASEAPLFLVEGELLTLKAMQWATNPEAVKDDIRYKRDRLLAESDWTQLNDCALSEEDSAAWAAYRQKLRDLTDLINDQGIVEFPTAP